MLRLEVDWALWTKRSGEHDDYSVVNSSHGLLSPTQFKEIILRYMPGNVDVAAALPRVAFSWFVTASKPYLGIAHQSVSDRTDDFGREVFETRYFCVPYQGIKDVQVSYLGLWEAFKEKQLPEGAGTEKLWVDVPGPGEELTPRYDLRSGASTVRDAAALLITNHPVCVLQAENVSLEDRLRFLDGVASLLPYGLRTRFTASTWTNSRTKHQFRLSFAQRAREGTHPIRWKSRAEIPAGEDQAAEYGRLLDRLLDRDEGYDLLIPGLVAHTEPMKFADAGTAVSLLRDMAAPWTVLDSLTNGTVDLDRIRTLFGPGGEIERLDQPGRQQILAELIDHGSVEDWKLVREWWPSGTDRDRLVQRVIQAAGKRLWAPVGRPVWDYVVLAEQHKFSDEFLAGLISAPEDEDDLEGGLSTAVQLLSDEVINKVEMIGSFDLTLAALWSNVPLAAALLAKLARVSRVAEIYGQRLDTYLQWMPEELADRLSPFKLVLAGSQVSESDIAELAAHSRTCLWALLDTACSRQPVGLSLVLTEFVKWLYDQPGSPYWPHRLGQLRPDNVRLKAQVDVLLMALGTPPTSMSQVDEAEWGTYTGTFFLAWEHAWYHRHGEPLRKSMQGQIDESRRSAEDSGWAQRLDALVQELIERSVNPGTKELRPHPDSLLVSSGEGDEPQDSPPSESGPIPGGVPAGTLTARVIIEDFLQAHRANDSVEIALSHVANRVGRSPLLERTPWDSVVGVRAALRDAGAPQDQAQEWAKELARGFARGQLGAEMPEGLKKSLRQELAEILFRLEVINEAVDSRGEHLLDVLDLQSKQLEKIQALCGELGADPPSKKRRGRRG